jgi:GDSL-like Lipase/Acylhydrolase family
MTGRVPFLLALLVLAGPAKSQILAEHPAECRIVENLIEHNFALRRVTQAIAAKRFSILVVGAGSSLLPGINSVPNAYPARLQHALAERLPGVEVKLTTDVKAKRSAAEMVKSLAAALAAAKPALVVWQTGTVDAMQAIDPEQFSQNLDKGINIARSAGADMIFINPQYSPRTESMIALEAYAEIMRWVALQQEVPLFDRFSIMKTWADLGTFDLYSATKTLDMAERVHDCVGRLLADLVIEAAKSDEPHAEGGR